VNPLLTAKVHEALRAAIGVGDGVVECSLDLDRSTTRVEAGATSWRW